MLYKGIIIEVKDEYSIVVTNESEFLRMANCQAKCNSLS